MNNDNRDFLWNILKSISCTNPDKAVRIVMLEKKDFDKAVEEFNNKTNLEIK